MGLVGSIQSVDGEAGQDLAGDDAAQRVWSGNPTKRQVCKQRLGCIAQRDQGGVVEGVRDAYALERTMQRVAQRRSEPCARLRVVLEVLKIIRGQVQLLSAENRVLPRLVVTGAGGVDGESGLQRTIPQVWFGEAKQNAAHQVSDAGLNLQSFAQPEEVIGGVA